MSHITQFEHLKIQLEAIKSATKNFANENCIGGGGFGKVYKGELIHSQGQQTMVALKRLDRTFGQGNPEFWKEIILLSLYRHKNIVSLLGYCDDSGEKILVYEYLSKKSLDHYLDKDDLTWVQRLKICIGAARGLAYLHTPAQNQLRILHRDIKSANILLDDNWNAKIADFGLSKFAPANQQFTYLVSNAVGTHGYCDPLYAETGLLTKESDVYSFGVVLFEVLCGRLCFGNKNDKRQPLIGLVRKYHEEKNLNEIICSKIKDEINPISLTEFTEIAFQCLKEKREERPLMTKIVKALESALKCQCSDAGGDEQTQIAGILKVKVLKGMGLKMRNPYVVLSLVTAKNSSLKSMKKSTMKQDNVNPEWNEEFDLYVEDDPDFASLQILVRNMTSVEMHEQVGIAPWGVNSLTPEKPDTQTLDLLKYGYEGYLQGKIMVEMVYRPFAYYTTFEDVCPLQKAPKGTPQGGGLLVIIIHQGEYLKGKHHTNPSVSLSFRGQLRKTMVCLFFLASLVLLNSAIISITFFGLVFGFLQSIKKDYFPIWEEEFTFRLEQQPSDEELHLEVISTPWKSIIHRKEESMGYVNINVVNLVNKRRINKTYNLENARFPNARLAVELQWRTID